ncbi:MAG: PEP-CTERM sorting domain-containing protein [Pseudomonadota bacterium]
MHRVSIGVVARHSVFTTAIWLALGAPASAVVLVDGSWSINDNVPVGPGDTLWPTRGLNLGNGSAGHLLVDGGSLLQVASATFGSNQTGTGTGLLSGAGSRIELTGNGFDQGSLNRFEVGGWGIGQFTVADGALLDGRANSVACIGLNHFCNNYIGNAAGSTAVFTVAGAGSEARFLRNFTVGGLAVFRPPIDSFTFGTPGGSTRGTVNVQAGGTLVTDLVRLGVGPGGSSPTGGERSFADVSIDGAGSLWRVTGGTLEPMQYANVQTGSHRNAWATLAMTGGGEMRIEGDGNGYTVVSLTNGGGRTDALVSGAGSRLQFVGQSGVLNVGASLGTATLEVRDGGLVDGMFYVAVGRSGAVASLLVDGSGSVFRVNGTATAAANTNTAPAYVDIGRAGGNGTVTVSNGGRIEVLATTGSTNGTGMGIGRDANSAGTLNIHSGGEVLFRSSSSAPGTASETRNPGVLVGRDGAGFLNISGGGKLLLEGGAVSTPTDRRSTALYIGGQSDTLAGGKGIAVVTGAGSEIRVSGGDSFIGVGIGAQSNGQLTLSAQAQLHGLGMAVGRSGGVGVFKADNATLNFSGQQTAGNLSGAFFTIGSGGTGIGVATLGNGSLVTLTNLGSAGAGVSLGGSGAFAGGEGSLTLEGGSRIEMHTQPGLNSLTVGREGSGFLRLRGASSIDLVDGVVQVARNSGSDGTVIASEGSTITAGWLGVGARKTDTGDADGGTGTVVLINSTLNAGQIVIGTNGFLGGTGTINGLVTNRGIFAPGNSPGRLEINGGFVAEAGSRLILEVQADGNGGFETDELVFNAGQPLDLSALKVEFRFLGATDPTAFNNSGQFSTDTFFQLKDAQGGLGGLAPELFATARFEARAEGYTISNFSFDAGAATQQFVAAQVPEPGTTALLLAGLASLAWLARRRQPA